MAKSVPFDVNEVNKLFKLNRLVELRGLSNRLIREASLENDYAKAELSIISYCLHKMETKEHITKHKKWHRAKKRISSNLDAALKALEKGNDRSFFSGLKKIIKDITKVDKEIGHFAQNIYEKAKVKHASMAYSYGLSISKSAQLTGADKKELQSYIGITTMHDEEVEAKKMKKRVAELKEALA